MRDRLQRAFGAVRAEGELKANTLDAIYSRARRHRRYPLAWAAACLVILLGFWGGLFFTPVSAIGIEINPALELKINRFDLVIGVESLNKDGERLAENTRLMFTEYSQAIDALLANSEMQVYLEQGMEMSINVLCDDEQRCGRMLEKVESCVGGEGNITCHAGGGSGHGHSGESTGTSGQHHSVESSNTQSQHHSVESSNTQSQPSSVESGGTQNQQRHQKRHGQHHSE